MDLSALQITAITIVVVATLVGVALFARTVGYLVRVIRLGAPDPTRGGRPASGWPSVLVETLGHARLGKWPLIGIMHWFVFVGFGALFFTLRHGLRPGPRPDVRAAADRPLAALRVGRGDHRLADRPRDPHADRRPADQPPAVAGPPVAVLRVHVLAGLLRRARRSSRVVVCVLALRGLEYALAAATGAARRPGRTTPRPPGSAGSSRARACSRSRTPSSSSPLVKILVSMAWFVTIALQPTMGVAWHRFLAFPNIWFKRHPGADRSAA